MTKKLLSGAKEVSQSAFKALTPIEHNLEKYAVGDTLMLTDDEADQLLEVNAIAPIASAS